jgi:outer membrane protein
MRKIAWFACWLALGIGVAWGTLPADAREPGGIATPTVVAEGKDHRSLTLRQCLEIALENNRWRPISRLNVEIAETQLGQALSSYWPQISAKASYLRLDEDPNFIFPQTSVSIPGFTIPIPGLPPIAIPPQSVTVPEQNIKLMDRDTGIASLGLLYPLYTGGMRPAVVKQAESGVAAAKQEMRRTDLQVIYDVKRYYYGAVLAKRLRGITADALARMEVTLELTGNLYKGGSTKVKKTDYLRNKAVVEGLRSTVALLKGNEGLALAALTNAVGLDWDVEIDVADAELPYRPSDANLAKMVGNAYAFNPDWKRLEEGVKASEAQVDEKSAGHYPQIALVGNLTHIENSYDKGMATPDNKDSWSAGIVLELPLFRGFRTKNEVREAKARLERVRQQRVLLREGIALQVKDVFLQMVRSQEQRDAMEEAVKAAEENRDLNERAYQQELVETKDVIEAQLVESFMKANNEKTLYDHIEARARLEFVVGKEIESALQGTP